MPARSEAQRKYLYSKFGPAWAKRHHFDNAGALPKHVGGPAREAQRRRTMARQLRKKRKAR